MVWILKENNYLVTEYYLKIIRESILYTNQEIRVVDEIPLKVCNYEKDIIIVANILKAFKLIIKGCKNLIVWFQGVVPEESYMRNHNIFRKKSLELIEKFVLKKTKLVIFVSDEMKKHFENKYKISFYDNFYIMPCFNTNIIRNSFFKKDKYSNNIFAYIGSLSPWQGFDEVLKCYEKIENLDILNTKLLVLTSDIENAEKKLNNSNISNYEVGFVEPKELDKKLADVKFGFIIREDTVINRVATPTKISTYLANGIIPIYSESLSDFTRYSKGYKYKLLYDEYFLSNLQLIIGEEIKAEDVFKEFGKMFREHYSPEYHKHKLKEKISQIF